MTYTLITIPSSVLSSLTIYQKDFLVKSGFASSNNSFVKNSRSNELHIIISQLAKKAIPFTLKLQESQIIQGPCFGCKK